MPDSLPDSTPLPSTPMAASLSHSPTQDNPSTSQYPVYRPRSSLKLPPKPTRNIPPTPGQIVSTQNAIENRDMDTISPQNPMVDGSMDTIFLQRSQNPPPESSTQQVTPLPVDSHEGKDGDDYTKGMPSHLKAVATNPIESLHVHQSDDLTPLRAHYLKKSLVKLQFERELAAITSANPHWPNVSTLSYLGRPFSSPPKDAPVLDMPFLRYIFQQFVLTFPFMASAPKNFYSQKLQPFVASMISRNLSASSVLDEAEGKGEQATRKKVLKKAEKNLSLFLAAATRMVEKEEVVRLTQVDLDRLEALTKRRQARVKKDTAWFDINVVCVRTVIDKGRVRSRAHDEFVIRTRRSRYEDVYVSRRYGDFRTLAIELTKAHPEELIKSPPQKDRTHTTVASPITPGLPRPSVSSENVSNYPTAPESTSRLAREKNRLTLRSYLHTLMASPTVLSSPVFRSFLLSDPITLTNEEIEDVKRREEADRVREDGRKKFAKEIAGRVDALRDALKRFLRLLVNWSDGLTNVFGIIKVTPNIQDLPPNYQAVTEWARISLASTAFQQFVASDNASETLAALKRVHGLMPYFMLKAALKISNPIGMIRNVLDLFLAQPFGSKSLLQRMFTSSLTEEVKQLQEEIEAVKNKVDDLVMCDKVRQFVYAPPEIQEMFKVDSVAEKMNIFVVILRSGEQPALSRPQMHRVARAHKAHAHYMKQRESLDDSDEDDGPQDEDAWLLEDLKVLAFLYTRLRDREMLIDLIFEGFTAELLKDIITIFYSPLAQVYRAASIADSLGDLQNFINDLIRTAEQVEEMIQNDPSHTVQAFIDLIQRHEQSFYYFVHKVHSKGEGLFNSLMQWVEMFLTVVREGLGDPLSLELLLPHTGSERTNILSEVDEVAKYHYKLKVIYEDKLRRRFGNAEGQRDADAEDEATQTLVNNVLGEINFGELADGDALDVAAEESDEFDDEYTSTDGDSTDEESTSSGVEDSRSEEDSVISRRGEEVRLASATHVRPQALGMRAISTMTPPLMKKPATHQTLLRNPPASSSSTSFSPIPVPTIRRSLSLRRMKSLTSLGSRKKSTDVVPPVPSLPSTPQTAAPILMASSLSKPLPPPPPGSPSRTNHPRSRLQRHSPQQVNKAIDRKKKESSIKPPELVHIPQLLPVFVELMRPALRVRRTVT